MSVKGSQVLINNINETRRADECTRNMLHELQSEANAKGKAMKAIFLSEDYSTLDDAIKVTQSAAATFGEIQSCN